MTTRRRQRLLHLDLKTVYSYGDQLLFELVRQTFNGWGGGESFDLTTTSPFRTPATASFVDDVNENFDGVVIGGGGLFPYRTNAAAASGWQWNITVDLLRRLRKPVVVFGAGNPPRFDPEKHNPVFRRHLNQTMSQSIFFGLRSTGAVDSMREFLDSPDDAPQLTLQPCPTTIGRVLLPRLAGAEPSTERRIGLQVGLEQAHLDSGLHPDAVFPRVVDLARRLRADGWAIDFVAHKRTDFAFFQQHGEELGLNPVRLYGSTDVLFDGVRRYARLPVVLGARGHSQMIPFGLGNIPLSLSTNDKIRYFAHEIGHPEWLVDPWQEDFAQTALDRVREVDARRPELHDELRGTQERFVDTTLTNLETIYERLTGERVRADLQPYTDRELSLAQADYTDDYDRRETRLELDTTKAELRTARRAAAASVTAVATPTAPLLVRAARKARRTLVR
jgi:hypothetical protein